MHIILDISTFLVTENVYIYIYIYNPQQMQPVKGYIKMKFWNF